MIDTPERHEQEQPLSDMLFDLFVFLPTGLAVTLVEELPKIAERGRERLGVQVNSARAVGQFAVKAGHHELKKRTAARKRTPSDSTPGPTSSTRVAKTGANTKNDAALPGQSRLRSIPRTPTPRPSPVAEIQPDLTVATPAVSTRAVNAHIPDVASLSIPGFDTLSASQVVQRLDGLSRTELVAVRAYETCTRGRRTILSRVDQLLDERS